MKIYFLLFFMMNLSWAGECAHKALQASRSIEAVNYGTEAAMKVKEHRYLGNHRILSGYLEKYESVFDHGGRYQDSWYQVYVFPETCIIDEVRKIEVL